MGAVPDRCRRIFGLRKVEGMPQRQIAALMGVTETMVENDVVKGQRLILQRLAEGETTESRNTATRKDDERARDRRGD